MSVTLFRTGIWIIIATLVAYVVRETYVGETLEFLNAELLWNSILLGAAVIGLGVVAWIGGKLMPQRRSKCRICGHVIPRGSVYCRPHLQEKLERARHADLATRRR
ncbi:MAG: hypothetical protein HYU52_02280 [Acidobacteria bacterium]|nr:hypothetical protein [Acidobacteriota bacterium]